MGVLFFVREGNIFAKKQEINYYSGIYK